MTERTNRANWDADQQYRHHLEMQEKRAAWEQEQKHQREQQERAAKQAALESHLTQRALLYHAHTGSTPPMSVLESWQRQYLDEQVHLQEAEREARRQTAINEAYDF